MRLTDLTQEEKERFIQVLEEERDSLPEYTLFGDSNYLEQYAFCIKAVKAGHTYIHLEMYEHDDEVENWMVFQSLKYDLEQLLKDYEII